MKTYKTLWPRICTFENLYHAWRKAKRGKSTKRPNWSAGSPSGGGPVGPPPSPAPDH